MVIGGKERTCHELYDVDAEVLVDHGAQADTCSRQPVEHGRERCIEDELYVVLTARV